MHNPNQTNPTTPSSQNPTQLYNQNTMMNDYDLETSTNK